MKDIIPRYWTMKGYRVTRSVGWDCQGLPVEYEVEKSLGFNEKKEIEEYGIAKFNEQCRKLVTDKRAAIEELEERIGRMTNDEEEYATMDSDYIESIWWSLKSLYDRNLLYEGFKVMPYSTRAGTSLSNAEVALGGYKKVVDPAITVMFELEEEPGTYLLAWTTTPWTIPSNLGLAVGKDVEYVKIEQEGNKYVLARELAENYFEDLSGAIPVSSAELVGKAYTPPFDYFKGHPNAHQIFYGDHVNLEEGTGIVHLAPYGAEDMEIFHAYNIQAFDVLDDQGDFTKDIPDFAGQNYRDANPNIQETLKSKGLLFTEENYEHEMPMCWRTDTPLIYKPITSWYVAMSQLREELVANNQEVNWIPEHIKDGRFGNWLAEVKDWGISRLRYWGTPLPVWKSDSGNIKVIGSFEELEELSGQRIKDPHRPYVDALEFELDGETYKRIPDVLDVWYDSGAMPFARFHYPFENKEKFDNKFPAEYISEGVDQTRGWFYSLLAISTALFNTKPYENVVVNGTATDDKGAKLSKSKKNYSPPQELLENYGADAIRLNFFATPIAAGEDTAVTDKTIKLYVQEFMIPLWNVYKFLSTYANIHEWSPQVDLAANQRNVWQETHPWYHIPFADVQNELDAWILLKLQNTIGNVTKHMDNYQLPKATNELQQFIMEISKWYIRRSRERFADGEVAAMQTLYYVLVEFSKLAAPFIPFITETIYRRLVGNQFRNVPESVHLCDYPVVDVNFVNQHQEIADSMEMVRTISELGQQIRTIQGIKVRQPLSLLELQFSTKEDLQGTSLVPWMEKLLRDELNVEEIIEVPQLTEKPTLITATDANAGINVGLETKLTPELESAGIMRELIRSIQNLRKQNNMQMGEEVHITYSTDSEKLMNVITEKEAEIKKAVSASELTAGQGEKSVKVNGAEISFSLYRNS